VSTLEAGRHHLVIGRPHAIELERRQLMAGAVPAAGFTAEQVQTKIEDA
jgi:hypothetical protein